MIGRNDICWCGSNKKWKKCHFPHITQAADIMLHSSDEIVPSLDQKISLPKYDAAVAQHYWKTYGIIIKTPQQIESIYRANQLAAHVLDRVCLLAHEGVTTNELNQAAHTMIKQAGAIPAPLGYGKPPYPKSICTSLNEVICHGIPNDIALVEGDIMNVDVSVVLHGFYGDCAKMVAIGGVTTQERKLVFDVSLQGLMQSIEQAVKPGNVLSEIGRTIQKISDIHGTSVVTDFVGHGVGVTLHENPQVPHHKNELHIPLVPGMIFTIEPMINAGVPYPVVDKVDKWTVRTKDGKASAQWEHTVLVTDTGYQILTPWTVTSCKIK